MHLPLPQFDDFGLFLRPIRAGDDTEWFKYLAMPEVICMTGWQILSISELAALIQPDSRHGPIRFALATKSDDRLVGTIGFHDLADGHAEIAYDLAPQWWNLGIGGAACACVSDWGLDILGLQSIKACAKLGNRASMRVLEKCGFLLEGTVREVRYANGEAADYWVYRRTSRRPVMI